MREIGIASKVRIVRYYSYKGTAGKIAPNLLQRDFAAEAPNQKWVTDVTQVTINDEKGYILPITRRPTNEGANRERTPEGRASKTLSGSGGLIFCYLFATLSILR